MPERDPADKIVGAIIAMPSRAMIRHTPCCYVIQGAHVQVNVGLLYIPTSIP
jgi:hypothetical protein